MGNSCGCKSRFNAVIEPSREMLNFFIKKAEKYPVKTHIIEGFGENIPFEDNYFDSVVSTLVLCSVRLPQKVLREIKRVLKPGGVFVFIEHVKAPEGTITEKFQSVVHSGWKWLFEGCDVKRETGKLIKNFFPDASYKTIRFSSPFIPVNYHIIGYATKRSD